MKYLCTVKTHLEMDWFGSSELRTLEVINYNTQHAAVMFNDKLCLACWLESSHCNISRYPGEREILLGIGVCITSILTM